MCLDYGIGSLHRQNFGRGAAPPLSSRDWWKSHRHRFALLISQAVIDECEHGDKHVATLRRGYLEEAAVLETTAAAATLAAALIQPHGPLPANAGVDVEDMAMSRQLSSPPTNSSKVRRAKTVCEAGDPLEDLHAYRRRLARFDNDLQRLCEYLNSRPLPPGFRRAKDAK
ncbi:MAG TPA: hypothetical protein VNY05_32935 [Candidatus Acidoferrales bacterium]|jgi:hypothetical protein|nr:hypothetical protein [Candidatus Acidoferrales bacterium]